MLKLYLNFFSASVWLVILSIIAFPTYAMVGEKIQILVATQSRIFTCLSTEVEVEFPFTMMLSASAGVIKLARKHVKAFCSVLGDSNRPSI